MVDEGIAAAPFVFETDGKYFDFLIDAIRNLPTASPMPTILHHKGYRISFFMADGSEPVHVHVTAADGRSAKFWVPARLARNFGLREHELREVLEILISNETLILEKWNEIFSNNN